MARFTPYTLQLQISRMFASGQAFFATIKVQDWLRQHQQNPDEYEILFHQHPAPPGSDLVIAVEIELKRKDGQPVDPWLQQALRDGG